MLFGVTLLLTFVYQIIEAQEPRVVCNGEKVDLVFVVDESSSIWGPDFRDQLKFIKDISEEFDVGPEKAQIAVITFGTTPKLRFYLNQYNSLAQVHSQIDAIQQQRGLTYTDLALKFTRQNMFTRRHGARPRIPKIVVVITDGESADTTLTAEQAKELKATGVTVFAIGIGDNYSLDELYTIASRPDFVFTADSYKALEKIRNQVSNASCIIVKTKPTFTLHEIPVTQKAPTRQPIVVTPQPTQESFLKWNAFGPCCEDVNEADVVFVASGYGGKTGHDSLRFVHDIITDLDVAPNKIKTALVSQECDEQTGYFLNTYTDKPSTLVHFYSEPTKDAMASSIKNMRIQYFTTAKGGRPGSRKIAVLLVDDINRLSYKTMDEIWKARLANIEVYVIGTSKGMDLTKLRMIASKPTSKYLYSVEENSKKQIRAMLASEICRDLSLSELMTGSGEGVGKLSVTASIKLKNKKV